MAQYAEGQAMLNIHPKVGKWVDLTDTRTGERLGSLKLYRNDQGRLRLALDVLDAIRIEHRAAARSVDYGRRE
jgi:hypothetical protein